jgi:hypothetical protein
LVGGSGLDPSGNARVTVTKQGESRNPLTAAISRDEGETWGSFRNLEDAPGDAWAYPAVTWVENRAYITYFNYRGGHSLFLRVLPAGWFYEKAPSA